MAGSVGKVHPSSAWYLQHAILAQLFLVALVVFPPLLFPLRFSTVEKQVTTTSTMTPTRGIRARPAGMLMSQHVALKLGL